MKAPMRNILALISGDAASRGLGFLVSVYLARVLAPDSFGLISVGLSVLAYLALINGPGIQLVETRNAAASPDGLPARVGSVLSMRLALVVPILGLTALVMLVLDTPVAARAAVLAFGLSLIPLAASLEWFFQGKEDFPSLTYSRIATMAAYAGLCVVVVRYPGDVMPAALAYLAGNLIGAAWLLVVYGRRFALPGLSWNPRQWRDIFRHNAPVGVAAFLAQSSINLPPIVTALVLGNAAAGIYSAAMKFVLIGLVGDRLVASLFLPLVSRYAASRPADVPHLVRVGMKTASVAVLAGVFSAYFLAAPAVSFVFGAGYVDAVPVFRILSLYVALTILNSLLTGTLVAFHGTREYSRIMTAGAVVLAACAFLLTPRFGLAGMAWSVVAGEAMDLILLARAVGRHVALPPAADYLRLLPSLASAPAAAVALAALPDAAMAVVVPAVFILVLRLTGALPSAELRFLREKVV
jgi:O-antigen/teichoic acid export membrane protein